MSIELETVLAANPATTRGQPTVLSCDAKGERIAYAVRPPVYLFIYLSIEICILTNTA
jgi:hypothetical protein